MKFEIKKRWTNKVAFTAEIDPPENASDGVKTALSVKWAIAAGIAISGLLLNLGDDGHIDKCTVTDSTVTGGTVTYSTVTGSTVTGSKVTYSTVTDSTVTGGTVTYSTVTDSTVTGSTVTDSTVTDSTVTYSTVTDSTVTYSTVTGGTVTGSTVTGSKVTYSTVTDSTVTGGKVTDSTVTGSTVTGSTVTGGTVTDSTVTDSTVTGSTVTGSTVTGGKVTDSTVIEGLPIPVVEKIHQKVHAAAQGEDAFSMSSWGPEKYEPECKTTRCRAGIVINEAGEAGYALKDQIGWEGAAWLIYKASDPSIERVPNFYATNDEALADMKRLAEKEALSGR